VVDLAGLRAGGPVVRGSVQTIYRWVHDGERFLVAEATDSGSAFDVGTFFTVPGSGRSRTELRHAVFRLLATPAAWQELTFADIAACSTDEEAVRRWDAGRLEDLRGAGAATHHVGLIDEETGEVTDRPVASAAVLVREFPVHTPVHFSTLGRSAWDYHRYQVEATKVLALEHIFRLGSPVGSSVEQRYRAAVGSGDPAAAGRVLDALGLHRPVVPWGRFGTMVYDCSTKYEDHDRYLDWQEAVHVSGVDHATFASVIELLGYCTILVNKVFASIGLTLWDIKWEAAVDGEAVVVVDTVDHDSVRITSDEIIGGRRCYTHFNKQAVRDYYRILHPTWVAALDDAKHRAEVDPDARTFREIYDAGVRAGEYPSIPELDPEFAAIQAEKYDLVAGGVSGRRAAGEASDAVRAVVEAEVRYYAAHRRREELLAHICPE